MKYRLPFAITLISLVLTGCSSVDIAAPNTIKRMNSNVHHISNVNWRADKKAGVVAYKRVMITTGERVNQFDEEIAQEQVSSFYRTMGGIFSSNVLGSTYAQKTQKANTPAVLDIEAIKGGYDLNEKVCDITVIATLKPEGPKVWVEAFKISGKCADVAKISKQLESKIIGRLESDGLIASN